tara:strand:- start:88 stop:876 length:789 start_codon:yes stop_codon:yes gene_type:complete
MSIFGQNFDQFEVLVFDNASQDRTLKILKKFSQVKVFESDINIGFGKAHNALSEKSAGKLLFILNPDTYLESKNTLSQIYEKSEKSSEVGLWGTKVHEGDSIAKPSFNYPGERKIKSTIGKDLPGSISWVIGASMIVRQSIFNQLNGFDPDFFLFSEETDLCLRIRKAGFSIEYHKEITIKHIGSESINQEGFYNKWKVSTEGLYLFYKKHYNPSDTQKLIRSDYLKALYRCFLLKFSGSSSEKADKYKAIRDVARKELDTS